MNLTTKYMTRNDCYAAGRKIVPAGIMIHSTATPGVMAAQWFERWNKSYAKGEIDRQVCVHAFVDDTGVWQYLPWDHRGWHAGGKANDTHIGIEICEPLGHTYSGFNMVGYDPAMTETRTVINGVEYIVESFFKEDARETAEQKIIRLIKECVAAEIRKTEGSVARSN